MRLFSAVVAGFAAAILAGSASAVAVAAPTVTEFPGTLPAGAGPMAITAGADGALWFVDDVKPGAIGRITTGGVTTEYDDNLTSDATFGDIAAGPGGVWFTETSKNKIGRVAADGTITEFSGASRDRPDGIAAGPDGNVWYVAAGHGGGIVRMTPSGAKTLFTSGLTNNAGGTDIALGADDNLWFTEAAAGRIGRITPQGVVTEFPLGLGAGSPQDITTGPDGNLWFTLNGVLAGIGRITPAGTVTTFTTGLLITSVPQGIASGADGNLHFTDSGANQLGTVTPSGTITTTSTGLSAAAGLRGIAAGSDGMLWFAEHAAGRIGRVSVAPGASGVTESGVSNTAATLTGTVRANGQATTAYVELGTTTAYGTTSVSASAGSGAATALVTATVTGLAPSTTYHARTVATNATGTSYGPDRTFATTAPGAPSATTTAPAAVNATSATLSGVVNPQSAATAYQYEWGETTAYGQTLVPGTPSAGSDGTDHTLADTLTGLVPHRTYHFRVVAIGNGTTYGADRQFTTDALAPSAGTGAIADVTSDGMTLNGTVNPWNSATAYRFEWGLTTAYDHQVPDPEDVVGEDLVPHAVSQRLTGLEPATTYHARLVAFNNAGVTYGADQTITTAAVVPVVAAVDVTDIAPSGATLRGTLDARHADTDWWFEWGPTTAYGHPGAVRTLQGTAAAAATNAIKLAIRDLNPATTYHARLVARNAAGTTYGPDVAFATTAAPVAAAPATPDDTPADGDVAPAPVADVPKPDFGASVVASVAAGVVRYRTASGALQTVGDGNEIPSGSTIDATHGELRLVTALDKAGHTQAARFRGAAFRLVQRPEDKGMVVLELRSAPTGCAAAPAGRTAVARAAAARRKGKPGATLWAKDSHGRYTTRGKGSVAVVRGTEWTTTETCAGTVTRVRSGAVSVRDVALHRKVMVKAGHQYLARVTR